MKSKVGNKNSRSRAFTLVELLIVIIIIGIMAGIFTLSVGAARDKAQATKIVSDMRVLKSAVILYRAQKVEARV